VIVSYRLFPFRASKDKPRLMREHGVSVLKTLAALLGMLDDFPKAAK
jgi:hypothetical protein